MAFGTIKVDQITTSTKTVTVDDLAATSALSSYLTTATAGATYLTTATAGTTYAAVDSTNTFTKGQAGSIVTLTDGATIQPDFSLGNNFKVELAATRNLANPTNLVAGQSGVIAVTQDSTGTRLLNYGSYWKFTGATPPNLTTTGGATDLISYYVASTTLVYAKATLNLS